MIPGNAVLCLWLVGWAEICTGYQIPFLGNKYQPFTGWGKTSTSPSPSLVPTPITSSSTLSSTSTTNSGYLNFKSLPKLNSLPSFSLPTLNSLPSFSLPSLNLPNLNSLPSLNLPSLSLLTNFGNPTNNPNQKLTASSSFNIDELGNDIEVDKLKKKLEAVGDHSSVEDLMNKIQKAKSDSQTVKLMVFAFTLARFALAASTVAIFTNPYAVLAVKVLEFFILQMVTPVGLGNTSHQQEYSNVIDTVMKTLPQKKDSKEPPPKEIKIPTKEGKEILLKLPISDDTKRVSFQLLDGIELLGKVWNARL